MQTKIAGFTLIIAAVLLMIYSGFTYMTTKNIVTVGPIHIDKTENHSVNWPPIIGLVLLVGVIAIIVGDKRVSRQ